MEREILFRGLRSDGKDWIYGDLQQNFDCFKIREKEVGCIAKSFVVIPESVGQFTGLTDKNGTKIFEGDKVKGKLSGGEEFNNVEYTVIFKDGSFQASFSNSSRQVHIELNAFSELKVIGNIHEK